MLNQNLLTSISEADVAAFLDSGVFDQDWYLCEYPDVLRTGIDPVRHYLWIGRRLNRRPSGEYFTANSQQNFNAQLEEVHLPRSISSNNRGPDEKFTNEKLKDNVRQAVYNEKSAYNIDYKDLISEHFDADFYLTAYPDIAAANVDPLAHYASHGEKEDRRPNRDFDPGVYLELNPDVANAGMPPFLHYLLHGRHEGRKIMKPIARKAERIRPSAPRHEQFEVIARLETGKQKTANIESEIVDIIIPVYRGYNDTLACIYSLLTDNTRTPREIIVLNDCSPEPELTVQLRRLASLNLFTLIENQSNLGFVETVNRGMQLHPQRDVLLLNSDTEVYNDWLDRIVAHGRQPGVASVTPFSNNATICSYPKFVADNPIPLEMSYEEIDRIAANCNFRTSVELPTGVGFCMYIQRSALAALGLFDFKEFGKGYGEENDFCMRAINAGWVNLIALDVFVRHTGETSFGADASAAQKRGLDALIRLHPTYPEIVSNFIRQDPALAFRRRLDIERLKKAVPGNNRILCLSHNWGGGIQRYIKNRAIYEMERGRGLLVCEPALGEDGATFVQVNIPDPIPLDNLRFSAEKIEQNDGLFETLRALSITSIEIHSLIGWPFSTFKEIFLLAIRLGVPYEVILHDYTAICPQITLTDASNFYCGEKGLSQCQACVVIKTDPSRMLHRRSAGPGEVLRSIDVATWRRHYQPLLSGASRVIAPTLDVAERFMRYMPDLEISIVKHRENLPTFTEPLAASFSAGTPLRVAIIGAIGPHKGSNVLRAIALEAFANRRDIEYVVIGYTNIDEQLKSIGNVNITGEYEENSVFEIIRRENCHVALLPSVWPETFSYTLSIASASGLPTIVFDIGAQGERAKDLEMVKSVPLSLANQPAALNAALLEFAISSAANFSAYQRQTLVNSLSR